MYGKRHQPHSPIRIKVFDGFHEADVAFLNEVGVREPVAQIPAGDRNHEAQMADDQRLCGVDVAFVPQRHGVFLLFFRGKKGRCVRGPDKRVQVAEGRRNDGGEVRFLFVGHH